MTCGHCGARWHDACGFLVKVCLTPGCGWWAGAAAEPAAPPPDLAQSLQGAVPEEGASASEIAAFAEALAGLGQGEALLASEHLDFLLSLARRTDLGDAAQLAGDLLAQSLKRSGDAAGLVAMISDPALFYRTRHLAAHLAAPAGMDAWAQLLSSWAVPTSLQRPTFATLSRHIAAPSGFEAAAAFFSSLDAARLKIALDRLGPDDAALLPSVAAIALIRSPLVQGAAAAAVRRIGDRAAMPLLARLQREGLRWVADEAREAAEGLMARPEPAAERLAAVEAVVAAAPAQDPGSWSCWLSAKAPPRPLGASLLIGSFLNGITLVSAMLLAVGLVLLAGNPLKIDSPAVIVGLLGIVGLVIGVLTRGNLSLYRDGVYTRVKVNGIDRVAADPNARDERERERNQRYHYRVSVLTEDGGIVETTWERFTGDRDYARPGREAGGVYEPGFASAGKFTAELPADSTPRGGFTYPLWLLGLKLLPIAFLAFIAAMALGLLPDLREGIRFWE